MKEEKFKVIQYTREFIIEIEKELENFPKKDIEIKSKIRNNSFELLEILYEANTTIGVNNPKKELLEKAIAKVKIIDFLINLSYDKNLINVLNCSYLAMVEGKRIYKIIENRRNLLYNRLCN